MKFVRFEDADSLISWPAITDAILAGHAGPKAVMDDVFLRSSGNTLLNRSAWIDGLGSAVKAATVFPKNTPSINGGVMVFSPDNGVLEAVIDFHLVTKWKTAGDSLLGAKLLARPNSERLLIIGAGTVAGTLVDAYRSHWPDIDISIWNRTPERAQKLAAQKGLKWISDLSKGVENADIISSATMTIEPFIKGEWLQPGQHLDLIGAYRADMREADDTALTRSKVFVDARASTVDHIGELMIPIDRGVISKSDVIADFYDVADGKFARSADSEITLFKNGGGAHLDLMVSRAILQAI